MLKSGRTYSFRIKMLFFFGRPLIDGIKIKENDVFDTQGHTKTSLNMA